jgi:hypothetical protein
VALPPICTERSGLRACWDALALDVGASLFPELQGFRVIAEDDADLFQHRVGVLLDQRQPFLVQHLIDVDLALDVGELGARAAARARRAPGSRSATRAPPASRV